MSSPKQVRALILSSSDDRLGIVLNWIAQETNVDEYRIYRGSNSVYPVTDGPYNIQNTDTLIVSVNGESAQTFVMSAVTNGAATAAEVVASIASPIGFTAMVSTNNPNRFVLRGIDDGKTALFEIVGGTALDEFGLVVGKYWQREDTKFFLIDTVLQTEMVNNQFEDRDGLVSDRYYVVAANTTGPFNPGVSELEGQPSLSKSLGRHLDRTFDRVVVWGLLAKPDGSPLVNAEVKFAPPQDKAPAFNSNLQSSDFGIRKSAQSVFTDEDGYFEFEAHKNVSYRIKIEQIDYDAVVRTDTLSRDFAKMRLDTTYSRDNMWPF